MQVANVMLTCSCVNKQQLLQFILKCCSRSNSDVSMIRSVRDLVEDVFVWVGMVSVSMSSDTEVVGSYLCSAFHDFPSIDIQFLVNK